jgi:hypothetical protein
MYQSKTQNENQLLLMLLTLPKPWLLRERPAA